MEENLDLRDVWRILQRRRNLITSVLAAGMLAAILFLLLVTPKFTSDATLKFNPSRFEINKQKSNIGSEIFERLIAGEIASIQSPTVLMRILRSEQLFDDPELNQAGLMDRATDFLNVISAREKNTVNREQQVLEKFKKKLSVTHPSRTNLISIAYESEDAKKAARVANAVARNFLSQNIEGSLSSAPLAVKWLNERKEILKEQWRKSEAVVQQYKAKQNLSYFSGKKLREQQIDRLNAQLVLAATKTQETRARVEQVRSLLKSRNYKQLASVVRSDVITRLRDRLAATSQREASLNSTLLPSHPQLQKVRAEVAILGKHIESEGRRMLDNLEVEFRSAQEREVLMGAKFDKAISNIQASGLGLAKLRELERTAASDKKIYEAFLDRSNETHEQSMGHVANFQLIKTAQVPIKPSFPSKLKILLLGALSSLLAGTGLAFLLETHSDTFRTRSDVSDILQLPTLTTVPHLNGRKRSERQFLQSAQKLVLNSPGSPFAKSISNLKLGLDITGTDDPIQVLCITSAEDGEGKTTVAVSLAQHAASVGAKVLLIDCNWWHPKLHSIFERTLRDAGGKNGSTSSPVIHDPVSGLEILPAFKGAGSSAGFSGSTEFVELLQSARNTYDLVIIDSGSSQSNLDSALLASEADATLLVIKWCKTRREIVKQSLETLINWNANVLGIVLNKADFQQLAKEGESVSAELAQKSLLGKKRRQDEEWNNSASRPSAAIVRNRFEPNQPTIV